MRFHISRAVRLQDKAVKRYVVRNIVDAASLRDIMEACTIDGEYLHGDFDAMCIEPAR